MQQPHLYLFLLMNDDLVNQMNHHRPGDLLDILIFLELPDPSLLRGEATSNAILLTLESHDDILGLFDFPIKLVPERLVFFAG